MGHAAERLAARHRAKIVAALRHSGALLGVALLLLALTATPTLLQWWDTAIPAAIGSALAAVVLFSVIAMLPLEFFAYLDVHFDREVPRAFAGIAFGRRLYRESGRLDAMAREAGLPALSGFESPDIIDTGEMPAWHEPEAVLPTIDFLIEKTRGEKVGRELVFLGEALRAAAEQRASFYLLLHTWAGFTNAEIHARRSFKPPAA